MAELRDLVGRELGPTRWRRMTQELVDRFGDVTDDRQWIHVEPERAAVSPLGGTIAHGLFTLSLGPAFSFELVSFDGFAHALNYGYDKVRFPAAVPVGARVRMAWTLLEVSEVADGLQLRCLQTFECDEADKPVCVAESLARLVARE